MPKSTAKGGELKPIENCYIIIPINDPKDVFDSSLITIGPEKPEYIITLDNLPDISDSKSANYNDETVIGRASPLKTYAQSDSRSISITLHFISSNKKDLKKNLQNLRAIQSAVYPRQGDSGAPFIPPPVCKIKCGQLLSADGELCVLLKNYSVKFPTDVVWDSETYAPYKFDVDTTWDVVYTSKYLPGQERIYKLGK